MEYLSDFPHVFGYPNGKGFSLRAKAWHVYFDMDTHYRKEEFEEYLKVIAEAGERLKKINTELAKENKGWVGNKATFII